MGGKLEVNPGEAGACSLCRGEHVLQCACGGRKQPRVQLLANNWSWGVFQFTVECPVTDACYQVWLYVSSGDLNLGPYGVVTSRSLLLREEHQMSKSGGVRESPVQIYTLWGSLR